MKALLHTIFAGILVTSVVTAGRSADVLSERDDIEPAVMRIARLHGLTLQEEVPAVREPLRTLAFEAPGCEEPLLITFLHVTFEEEPLIRTIEGERSVVSYVYLDHVWNGPDRLAIFFEWKIHKTLRLLNLTRYVPSRYVLRLASPPSCRLFDTIDWRDVWKRDPTAVHDKEFDLRL